MYLKGPTHYEGLLNVALVASGPGITRGGVVSEPVSTLDLAPTFYELAGLDTPVEMQGQSFAPLLTGQSQTRDFAYNEWDMQPSRAGVPLKLRTVRTADAKLTIDELSGTGEMYLLNEDPDEMDNRFDDPACKALQAELTDMIRARPGPLMESLPEHEA